MKKRILALLLAGLLTASAVACKTESQNPNNNPVVTTTQKPDGNTNPNIPVTPVDNYKISNDKVYALNDNLPLYTSADVTSTVAHTVAFKTELSRLKYNSTWSVINYQGTDYYTLNSYVTTDDIAQKNFDPLSDIEMYVAESGYVLRNYPTQLNTVNGQSNKAGSADLATSVWAVSKSKDWVEIKLEQNATKTYFISTKAVKEGKVPTLADLGDYQSKFPGVNATTTTTYYVITTSLTIRERPSAEEIISPSHGTLKLDAEIQVTAIAEVNGSKWAEIRIYDEALGANKHYYVSAAYISTIKGGPVETLDTVLAANPLFKEYAIPQVMYVDSDVSEVLNLRSAPTTVGSTVEEEAPKGAELNVVAYGTDDKLSWCIVLYKSNYYFASIEYLTPHGADLGYEPILSLSEALKLNSNLTERNETPMSVKAPINYYAGPDLSKDMGDLATGDTVIVVGSGRVDGVDLYIIRHNGGHYFIVNNPNKVA